MANIPALKTEITDDPLLRGYSGMTDEQVAADLNTIYRNAPASMDSIRTYLLLEVKTAMTLFGRIAIVAESAVLDDPIGEGVALSLEHITAAKSMMAILQPASGFSLDTNDSRFSKILSDLAAGSGCKAISAGDKAAIEAFSINQQSRATELGLGRVRPGGVAEARN